MPLIKCMLFFFMFFSFSYTAFWVSMIFAIVSAWRSGFLIICNGWLFLAILHRWRAVILDGYFDISILPSKIISRILLVLSVFLSCSVFAYDPTRISCLTIEKPLKKLHSIIILAVKLIRIRLAKNIRNQLSKPPIWNLMPILFQLVAKYIDSFWISHTRALLILFKSANNMSTFPAFLKNIAANLKIL